MVESYVDVRVGGVEVQVRESESWPVLASQRASHLPPGATMPGGAGGAVLGWGGVSDPVVVEGGVRVRDERPGFVLDLRGPAVAAAHVRGAVQLAVLRHTPSGVFTSGGLP